MSQPELSERSRELLRTLGGHQTWGFTCPLLNVIVPWVFWKRHMKGHPELDDAARAILNFQLTWSFLLALPLLLLIPGILSPAWIQFYQDYSDAKEGYYGSAPDYSILLAPVFCLAGFLLSEIFLTALWAALTLKLKAACGRGEANLHPRGILPFLKK